MGLDDKVDHDAQDAKGRLKEGAGGARGSDKLEAEVTVDQTKADVTKAGGDVEDAFTG